MQIRWIWVFWGIRITRTLQHSKQRKGRPQPVNFKADQWTAFFVPPVHIGGYACFVSQSFAHFSFYRKQGLSAYSGNTGLIDNYINPILGEYNIQDINRRVVDRFILELQKTTPVNTQFRKARTETLPPCTIEKICKVMHCAFRQAVRWDMIPKIHLMMCCCLKRKRKYGQSGQ